MYQTRKTTTQGGTHEEKGRKAEGGKQSLHKGFEDPAAFDGGEDQKVAIFRRVRAEIRDWIEETFGG